MVIISGTLLVYYVSVQAELKNNKHNAAPNKDLLLCLLYRYQTISIMSNTHTFHSFPVHKGGQH